MFRFSGRDYNDFYADECVDGCGNSSPMRPQFRIYLLYLQSCGNYSPNREKAPGGALYVDGFQAIRCARETESLGK